MQTKFDQLQSPTESTKVNLYTLKQENNLLMADLQKQNRYNKTLKQRLEDERFFYQKEKEYFCKELAHKNAKLQKTSSRVCTNPSHERACELATQYQTEILNLKLKIEDLENKLEQQSEESYDLCSKFLRMKHTRDQVTEKYAQLQEEYLKVLAQMMTQLDETRKEVNFQADKRFEQPIHPTSAIFLQVLQRNSRLMHENSQLRLENQKLKFLTEKHHQKQDRFNKSVNSMSPMMKHLSSSFLEKSSRTAERIGIIQRYKKHPGIGTDPITDVIASENCKCPNFSSPPSHGKKFLPLTSNDSEHSDLNCVCVNPLLRTVSAPAIIQTSASNKQKNSIVDVYTKECSTNT